MNVRTELVTPEQVAFFRENGYLQLQNFLDAEEVEAIKRAMVKAIAAYDALNESDWEKTGQTAYGKVLNQKVNLWRIDPDMKRVSHDWRFAEVARQLAGATRIRLFHDHALLKMPGDSKPTPWHQDTPYWPMHENGALSIWIALDDVDEHNGCLSFIPRTRDLGRLDPVDLVNPQDIFRAIKRGELAEPVQVMRMKAGGVTFHDGLTFHYADANSTDRPRHALAIIYMPDGTRYNGKSHPVTDGLGLTPDAPIEHELFPVLAG